MYLVIKRQVFCKRILFFNLIFSFLFSGVCFSEVTQITDDPESQSRASLYNGTMAWSNDYQAIYYWDGNNTQKILDTLGADDWAPSLYDGEIAWVSNSEIYYYDGSTTLRITNDSELDTYPSLYNGTIAWLKGDNIMYWNGTTTSPVTTYPAGGVTGAPSLFDGEVAWSRRNADDDSEIYFWNGTDAPQAITVNTEQDFSPTLYDGTIAWVGGTNIMYWNGATTEPITTYSASAYVGSVSLFDGTIAWSANISGGFNLQVYFWNGNSIQQITDDSETNHYNVSLYDGTIAWNAEVLFFNDLFYWVPRKLSIDYLKDGIVVLQTLSGSEPSSADIQKVSDLESDSKISLSEAIYSLLSAATDNDNDSYTIGQGDCDDNDPLINPAAIEICDDTIDQDCDGSDLVCVLDCEGILGGTAYLDDCGVCDDEPGNDNQTCFEDCNGVWGGTAYDDNCYICVGGNTGLTPCVQDCNNDWGGTAYYDGCSTCVEGNTGLLACTEDCNGELGGSAYYDNCNVCVGGTTGETACTADCGGYWGGSAYYDNCSTCVGGDTGLTPCVEDCNDQWGGTAYVDECSDCVGGATGQSACTQDCIDEWGGTAHYDNCGTCVDGNTGLLACTEDCWGQWGGSAYIDDCGDCVGGATGVEACTLDCDSVWGGTAYIDNCDECVGGTTGIEACTMDCNSVWGGDSTMDECLVCDNDPTNDNTSCVVVVGGLMWQQARWSYNYPRTYEVSESMCANLDIAGYDDWRLPTKTELKNLVVCTNGVPTPLPHEGNPYLDPNDPNVEIYSTTGIPHNCYQLASGVDPGPFTIPTIDPAFGTGASRYWTSTDYNTIPGRKYTVNFGNGACYPEGQTSTALERCVRVLN